MSAQHLFINPPVEDFSCSNYYSLPFGMLRVMRAFSEGNLPFFFYDFLHPEFAFYGETHKLQALGRSAYPRTEIEKPAAVKELKRIYKRYGNSTESFRHFLASRSIEPGAANLTILINTDFTYRAAGVVKFVRLLESEFGVLPGRVVLGGTAAVLLPDYFRRHLPGVRLFSTHVLTALTQGKINDISSETMPYLDVYKQISFLPFRISQHCPMQCHYCASRFLGQKFRAQDLTQEVMQSYLERYREKLLPGNFAASYDDALLQNIDLVEKLFVGQGFQICVPNGLHLKFVNPATAEVLKSCGFAELRFGIETLNTSHGHLSSFKLDGIPIESRIRVLESAGFRREQIRLYVLYGLPEQKLQDVTSTIVRLKEYGCRINLCGYSPIPHTKLFESLPISLQARFLDVPELTNNNTVALWNREFSEQNVAKLHRLRLASQLPTSM